MIIQPFILMGLRETENHLLKANVFQVFKENLQSNLKVTDTRLAVSKDCGRKVWFTQSLNMLYKLMPNSQFQKRSYQQSYHTDVPNTVHSSPLLYSQHRYTASLRPSWQFLALRTQTLVLSWIIQHIKTKTFTSATLASEDVKGKKISPYGIYLICFLLRVGWEDCYHSHVYKSWSYGQRLVSLS